MSIQKHRVKRFIFEVGVEQEAQAQALHAELGGINRTRILPLLDQSLADLTDHDELIRLESVELDLGALPAGNFEETLVEKLQAQITDVLRREIAGARRRQSGGGATVGTQSTWELLQTYVETGCLPWWAEPSEAALLDSVVGDLIDRSPDLIRHRLPTLLRNRPRLERLVRSLDQEVLARLVALMSGLEAAQIEHLGNELISLIAARAIVLARTGAVRHRVWAAMMVAAQHDQDHGLDALGSLRPLLMRVSAELSISYGTLISTLDRSIAPAPRPTDDIKPMISKLRQLQEAADAASGTASRDRRHGWDKNDDVAGDRVDGQPETGALSAPRDAWLELLRRLQEPPGRDQNRLGVLVEKLMAGEPPLPLLCRQLLGFEGRLRPLLKPSLMEALTEKLRHVLADPLNEAIPAEDRRATSGDLDEVYLENAGLVILWPFMEPFFRRLDLLADRTFRDAAAANRAVGLLQYLVTTDPFGPEYLLPLNKVLCGLNPTDLFTFDQPLTDVEQEESDHLLAAMIERAPILRKMSNEGFRGNFLLRKGSLTTADGAWLLRVERQSYDLVLERFPWSFEWIKLPWMQAALRVEW